MDAVAAEEDELDRERMTQQTFWAKSEGRHVPGVLWAPAAPSGPVPLVLIGHGGSQHKESPGPQELAERFVLDYGFAAAAIDGPVHGQRRSDHGVDPSAVFSDHRADIERPASLTTMAADWRAALDLLHGRGDLTIGPVGYWGLSMGTLYGLPFLAGDDRVQAAVLGLWGAVGTAPETWAVLSAAADAVRCSLLFLAQVEDQLFALPGAVDLFTRLASRDKRMQVNVGAHGDVPADATAAAITFLVNRLSGTMATT